MILVPTTIRIGDMMLPWYHHHQYALGYYYFHFSYFIFFLFCNLVKFNVTTYYDVRWLLICFDDLNAVRLLLLLFLFF